MAKINPLTEPIEVTVHKILNNRPTPVQLPVRPGEEVAGKGFTYDDVRELELALYHIAGDGLYHCDALGANGEEFKWHVYYKEAKKVDTNATTTGNNGQPHTVPHSQTGWLSQMTPGQTAVQGQAPLYPQQQTANLGGAQMGYQYGPPQFGSFGGSSSFGSSKNDDEREARLRLEAQLERQKQETTHQQQMQAITQELRRVQEQMGAKPAHMESEAIKTLEKRLEEERKEREREKDASRTETLIRELRDSTQKQIEAVLSLVKESAERRDEPGATSMMMIQMMQQNSQSQLESTRLQAEAQKEMARLQAEAQKDAARNAIGPREMIELMSRMNTGQDQLAQGFARMWDMGQNMIETVMNLNGPQIHPALQMLQEGLQSGLGLAQQAMELRGQQAQANAVAQERQQQMMALQAQGNLAGAQQHAPEVDELHAEAEQASSQLAETEEELFGPAWPSVEKLRMGVKAGMINADQATAALLKGIETFAEKGEVVPAFVLWQNRDFVQLVEILVPEAPTSFKDRYVSALVAFANQVPDGGEEEEAQAPSPAVRNRKGGKQKVIDAEAS